MALRASGLPLQVEAFRLSLRYTLKFKLPTEKGAEEAVDHCKGKGKMPASSGGEAWSSTPERTPEQWSDKGNKGKLFLQGKGKHSKDGKDGKGKDGTGKASKGKDGKGKGGKGKDVKGKGGIGWEGLARTALAREGWLEKKWGRPDPHRDETVNSDRWS